VRLSVQYCRRREAGWLYGGLMDISEEQNLAKGLAQMDEAAWEQFCRLYGPPLLSFVRYALGLDAEKADEAVQMTLIRCVRSISTFDPARGNLFAWLKAISRNEAHTLARRDQKHAVEISHSAFQQEVVERILQTVDTSDLPDEILARRDLQLLVREVLMSLPERQRKALVMKYVEEIRVAEIARQLGASEKAVESLLSRSRGAFRAAFLEKVSSMGSMREGGIQ